jgi:DMSO/TMAO reductase YedYZ molybdopterin-dependent catalytic subunit
MTPPFSPGFHGRKRSQASAERLPPGQYETRDFPVLSAGPTPHLSTRNWDFSIVGSKGNKVSWTWDEFQALPHQRVTRDIHCVTKWSKFDTKWEGISIDTLLNEASTRGVARSPFAMAVCEGGYTTNVSVADLTDGKAMVAFQYDDAPLVAEHGGPARLLVPHLYFWKSAKWIRQLRLLDREEPGFWEVNGYHIRGDPWREQRYTGDV